MLRKSRDLSSYQRGACDREFGSVNEFYFDDQNWAVRYLVAGTSWAESKVFLSMNREPIKNGPEFTDAILITQDYEERLHQHYDRHGYWADKSAMKAGR